MMKRNVIIVMIVLTLIIPFRIYVMDSFAKDHEQPLKYRIIVIDPGHGGLDNGAIEFGYNEDEINLEISKKLKSELEYYGATVYLTRDGDYDMTERDYNYSKQDDMYLRVNKIDSFHGHYLISIHQNASVNSSAWGSQVFYYHNSEKGKELAGDINESLKSVTNSRKPISGCGFRVLRATKVVGVLIECGFMSNYNECGQLRSQKYQTKLVQAIAQGLIDYDEKVKKSEMDEIEKKALQ